jgi:glycosyltransferase involved in cell wall biosynthesis
MLDVSVVLPVYNEEESLTVLRPELLDVLEYMLEFLGLRSEVIFVDDGSGDRNSTIIRGFHKADHRVRLLGLRAHAGRTRHRRRAKGSPRSVGCRDGCRPPGRSVRHPATT